MLEKGNGMNRINKRMYMEAQTSPWLSGLCMLSETRAWIPHGGLTSGLYRLSRDPFP